MGDVIRDHVETALHLIGANDDPLSRFHDATSLGVLVAAEVKALRREAVEQLRGRGLSLSDISSELGLSRQRIEQISHGR